MNWADYFLIAVLVFSCLTGVMRGLLRELISLVSWIAAVWIAWAYAPLLEPHLGGVLAEGAVAPWAARTLVFVAVVLIGTAVGVVVTHLVRLSIFSGLDRLVGAFFGLLRGLILIGLLVLLCHALRLTGEPWWRGSTLRPYAEHAANVLRDMVGEGKIKTVDYRGS